MVDYLSLSGSSKPNQSSSSLDKKGELGGNLELGELEQLTIANENETSYDVRLTRTKQQLNRVHLKSSFITDNGTKRVLPQDLECQVHSS